jgi:hypothetical protein
VPYCIAPYPSHPGRAVDAIVENPSSDAVAATAVAVAQAKVLTTEIAIDVMREATDFLGEPRTRPMQGCYNRRQEE